MAENHKTEILNGRNMLLAKTYEAKNSLGQQSCADGSPRKHLLPIFKSPKNVVENQKAEKVIKNVAEKSIRQI